MRIQTDGKVYHNAVEWRKIFSKYEVSGASPKEFCQKEQLLRSSFNRWRLKLNAPKKSEGFVPVTRTSSPAPSWSFQTTVPNGCRLRFQE